jgi:hypothetical protein
VVISGLKLSTVNEWLTSPALRLDLDQPQDDVRRMAMRRSATAASTQINRSPLALSAGS